jgi:hypothetical protein
VTKPKSARLVCERWKCVIVPAAKRSTRLLFKMREQNRLLGRLLPRRAVGSTLLLKGLEAEVSVILNADEMNARNLYVAITRGSKRLVVCARSPVLNPRYK